MQIKAKSKEIENIPPSCNSSYFPSIWLRAMDLKAIQSYYHMWKVYLYSSPEPIPITSFSAIQLRRWLAAASDCMH